MSINLDSSPKDTNSSDISIKSPPHITPNDNALSLMNLLQGNHRPKLEVNTLIIPELKETNNQSTTISIRSDSPKPPNGIQKKSSLFSVISDIKKLQFQDFAKQFFNKQRRSFFFLRRQIPLDELINFSAVTIPHPLLTNLPSRQNKNAIACFNLILQYTGVKPTDKSPPIDLDTLINFLFNNPALRDEVYFQLVKQTRQNPNSQWLLKTWELFLILATIFPSTRNSENHILSHIASSVSNYSSEISTVAQFTYVRFEARCSLGKEAQHREYIHPYQDIPKMIAIDISPFQGSINEFMWYQRNKFPDLPVPYILTLFIEKIISMNGLTSIGIFRLPGNMKKVDQIVSANILTEGILKDCTVNDVASLLKRWLRDLSVSLIPDYLLISFSDYCECNNYNSFLDQLTETHKFTLLYLVGFLQICVKNVQYHKMNSKAFATVFAPNIAACHEIDSKRVQTINQFSIDFLNYLITYSKTENYYPLQTQYFK